MRPRQAACEPCRQSKLGCDHLQPVCSRCRESSKESLCEYRTTPFKRRKRVATSFPSSGRSRQSQSPHHLPAVTSPGNSKYPNPGFLGSLSSPAIFGHVSSDQRQAANNTSALAHSLMHVDDFGDTAPESTGLTASGAALMKDFFLSYSVDSLRDLISFWSESQRSLALAEPFIQDCAESMCRLVGSCKTSTWHTDCAEIMLRNSQLPLENASSSSSFVEQFSGQNVRWETLGLFASAIVGATTDVRFFPSLYKTDAEKYFLKRRASRLADLALNICLSLDCLNDLQMILQYEVFIVHSLVDGDQSYDSWRRLGDAISSVLALGYHQKESARHDVPSFIVELRNMAFARIYSADKNVATFLGRPPRLCSKYCHFRVPKSVLDQEDAPGEVNFAADTSWSASCALLKEEVLELLFEENLTACSHKASMLQEKVEHFWQRMPLRLRLAKNLKDSGRNPFERDFMLSSRLNYLHALFLLQFAQMGSPKEPSDAVVEIAQEMLSLSVEAILQRDNTTNSGTGLTWKVVHYGLPSAGIVLLSVLRPPKPTISDGANMARVKSYQHLRMLAAEVQMGALSSPLEPNYALLSRAATTITKHLDSKDGQGVDEEIEDNEAGLSSFLEGYAGLHTWDFDVGFWDHLAEFALPVDRAEE